VEWVQTFALSNPQVEEASRLSAFREACEQLGIDIPENFEALLVLADRFKTSGRSEPR
jgi:hypothetical protein